MVIRIWYETLITMLQYFISFYDWIFQNTVEEKVKKEDYTSDGAIDRHGHPAVREKTGDWVAAILILGIYHSTSTK